MNVLLQQENSNFMKESKDVHMIKLDVQLPRESDSNALSITILISTLIALFHYQH